MILLMVLLALCTLKGKITHENPANLVSLENRRNGGPTLLEKPPVDVVGVLLDHFAILVIVLRARWTLNDKGTHGNTTDLFWGLIKSA